MSFMVSARNPSAKQPPSTLSVIGANRDASNVAIVAGELVEVRYPKGTSLSLLAAKLLANLIHDAGVAVVEDKAHSVPLAEINWSHRSGEELEAAVLELQQTVIQVDITNPRTGLKRRKSGQFLTDVERDLDAPAGTLTYRFSNTVRHVVKNSHHWAAISLRAVMAMEGKYSVALYQMLALYVGRRQVSETFKLDDLRLRLGVGPTTLVRWKDFRVRVLEPAVAEINHLTGFRVEWTEVKRGRAVSGVTFRWAKKNGEELKAADEELVRPRPGRKARRAGTVERIADESTAMRATIGEQLAGMAQAPVDDDPVMRAARLAAAERGEPEQLDIEDAIARDAELAQSERAAIERR